MDGATGTMLEKKGLPSKLPLWSTEALFIAPEKVQEIHQEYIRAGAEIITANTFRTNKRTFQIANIKDQSKELTGLAVKLANEAIKKEKTNHKVWIAGSIAPLEDCYRPDLVPEKQELKSEHKDHIKNLVHAGVDILLIETMNTIIEAEYALIAASKYKLPIILSFVVTPQNTLLSGESLKQAVDLAKKYMVSALMINCTPVAYISDALKKIKELSDIPIGVYANIGHVDDEKGWESTHDVSPEAYANQAELWIKAGARIVGGCCGTTPDYITEILKKVKEGSKIDI